MAEPRASNSDPAVEMRSHAAPEIGAPVLEASPCADAPRAGASESEAPAEIRSQSAAEIVDDTPQTADEENHRSR